MTVTLTFNLKRAMVMTHTHYTNSSSGQSVQKDRVETNGRTEGR